MNIEIYTPQNEFTVTFASDDIVMQYRQIRFEDGWRTRKERIGAAFNNANGSICLRLSGQQLIEGDIYLFPNDNALN